MFSPKTFSPEMELHKNGHLRCPDVEGVSVDGVEDVQLARLAHRADDEEVFSRRVPLGLVEKNRSAEASFYMS
jgi:hypothetical protein